MPLDTGGQFRFMIDNLLNAGVNSISSSSVNVDFPLSNLSTKYRGRPFKFNGRFLIDSTNNKFYFNDGAAKTATIASSDYSSRTSFATAIQTALNAVGSTFVVTWSTSLQSFVISHTGTFTIDLTQTSNAIWNTIGFVDTAAKTGAASYTADEKRFHWPYEYIAVDFGYHANIGFLGLVCDAIAEFPLTPMATIKIQANTIDLFTAPPLDRTLTRNSEGIFEFFDTDDFSYRYWRLTILDNTAIDDPYIGYMYLGEYTKFTERYNSQGAVTFIDDNSDLAISESGQVYSLNKPLQRQYDSLGFEMLNPADKDLLSRIWKRFKKSEPFFVSVDPKLEITSALKESTFMCRFKEKPEFTHIVFNQHSTKIGVIEWL